MTIPDRIERTVELAHPPEKVWEALTTADGLSGWFGSSAEVDLRPGGLIDVRWDDQDRSTLRIEVVEPLRRFAFTWAIDGLPATDPRRTYVEFSLEPITAGTRLTLVESGFAQAPAEAYRGNVQGWRQELGELVTYLDGAA